MRRSRGRTSDFDLLAILRRRCGELSRRRDAASHRVRQRPVVEVVLRPAEGFDRVIQAVCDRRSHVVDELGAGVVAIENTSSKVLHESTLTDRFDAVLAKRVLDGGTGGGDNRRSSSQLASVRACGHARCATLEGLLRVTDRLDRAPIQGLVRHVRAQCRLCLRADWGRWYFCDGGSATGRSCRCGRCFRRSRGDFVRHPVRRPRHPGAHFVKHSVSVARARLQPARRLAVRRLDDVVHCLDGFRVLHGLRRQHGQTLAVRDVDVHALPAGAQRERDVVGGAGAWALQTDHAALGVCGRTESIRCAKRLHTVCSPSEPSNGSFCCELRSFSQQHAFTAGNHGGGIERQLVSTPLRSVDSGGSGSERRPEAGDELRCGVGQTVNHLTCPFQVRIRLPGLLSLFSSFFVPDIVRDNAALGEAQPRHQAALRRGRCGGTCRCQLLGLEGGSLRSVVTGLRR